jgi:hypothetical protein
LKTLFATDFDGTLFRSDCTMCEADLEALSDLRARGVVTVLATGRSPFSLQRAVGGVPLPFDWMIHSSGAGMISSGGEVIVNPGLSPTDVLSVRSFLENRCLDYSVQGPYPDSHLLYHGNTCPHPDHRQRRELYRGHVRHVGELSGPASQFVVYLEAGGATHAEAAILEALGASFQVIRTTSPLDHSTVWIEIFPRGVHKGAAMLALASRLGIPRSGTAALGNDWNDKLMLECAGTAFVVDGAPEGLAPGAIRVPGSDHHAVRHAALLWMEMTL